MALRGHGLPRSRAMTFNMLTDPELSRRSTVPGPSNSHRNSRRWNGRRSSHASSLTLRQPESPRDVSRDTTWQTVSWFSEPLFELPLFDLDFEDWCKKILEYVDREDLEIASASEDIQGNQSREMSWITDTASSLPHLDSLHWQQEQCPTRSPSLGGRGIKQQRRNAIVFGLLQASLANPRASSAGDTHEATTPSSSLTGNLHLPSGYTLISGISGGYRQSPEALGSGRNPPHHHSETLRVLEGNGPFVLDARDISRSQFRGMQSDSDDTITLGSSYQLQSMLRRDAVDGSPVEEQGDPWTSGVFNQLGDEIVSSLRNMDGAAARDLMEEQPSPDEVEDDIFSLLDEMGALGSNNRGEEQENRASPGDAQPEPRRESVDSEDRSSPAGSPLPSLPIIVPASTGSKKGRFGRLGRWWKRVVTR
ncbi:hypothetical protein P171DRAFT_495225 [Karstenula rhodostoma CBS 690.94]|uniref:Uncharacterized protein n=1 Tax=Karstenula rhodostoma CBS 690.94 TaxID=1392251 RepID=A0A9P4PG17_9PLEO|nr:hypothetical protein P171DRAFT_495225 [Karstenula rhodostoma CBS 690.94]